MKYHGLLLSIVLLALGGCTIPRGAPLVSEIYNARIDGIPVVPIASYDATEFTAAAKTTFPDELLFAPQLPLDRLSVGDRLKVTIIESSGNGEFPVTLDSPLVVDEVAVQEDGYVNLPYANRVRAAGKTITSLEQSVEGALRRTLYAPQVSISRNAAPYNSVTIQGSVSKGGSYIVSPELRKLSALLAVASLQSEPDISYRVQVRRGEINGQVNLADLYSDPHLDISLYPGDLVTVTGKSEFMTILGAVAQTGRYPIAGSGYSLMDALATARGLDDVNADPNGVFVFRTHDSDGEEPARRVIYHLDIRDPSQVFLASNFAMRPNDVIYVSNASFTQTRKALSAISGTLGFVSRTAQTVQ